MKVGVFIENRPPNAGGGYTFESEVLKSLVKFGAESQHTFVVFSWAKEPPQEILSSPIQFISLAHSFSDRTFSKLFQTALRIFKKLKYQKIELWLEKSIAKNILNSRVEIIWYLTPWVCPTMDIPYITVVWDLQHRLQPYFPEVSTEGNWYERADIRS